MPVHRSLFEQIPIPDPAADVLLMSKLAPPQPPRSLLPRPQLLERLNQAAPPMLTLVAAPAGYGKTTLLSAWLSTRTEGRGLRTEAALSSLSPQSSVLSSGVAWLTLDAADSDSLRFWLYVIAALQTVDPRLGGAARAQLRSPSPLSLEVIVAALINDLESYPRHIILVIDDYHLIDDEAIHDSMAFLLEHLPPQLHLVLATRRMPPFSLARVRARGQSLELRAADLHLTADEATALLECLEGIR